MVRQRNQMVECNRDLVLDKVKKCFPGCKEEEIMAFLDLYGEEPYERGRERVQIAILKLSDGDLDQLLVNVEVAKRDYRDVLAYAEYPEEMSNDNWKMSENEEIKRIRVRDRKQYIDWLLG